MKRLLFIFLLFPVLLQAQHLFPNKYTLGPGEYNNWIIDNATHRLYQLVDLPFHYSGVPDSFVSIGGGAHHALFVSQNHRAWAWGDNTSGECGSGNTTNQNTPIQINTDSLGNTFDSITKVMTGGTGEANPWNSFALRNGKVYGWGSLAGGLRGNGTFGGQTTRPVQIPFPSGTYIVDIQISFIGVALDSAGNVWTWGGGYNFYPPYLLAQGNDHPVVWTPTKVTLPARAKQICGGDALRWFALLTNGQVYGAAWHINYLGFTRSGDMSQFGFAPARVDTCWHISGLGSTRSVDTIAMNSMYTYLLLSDSTAWGFGSNAIANAGDGTELDMRHYVGANGYSPYNWDQSLDENMYYAAKQIMPGMHNFTKIFVSTALNYWGTLENAGDSIFVFGRNKGGVIGNMVNGTDSVGGELGSSYPNSWDVLFPTYINPFAFTFVTRMTSPICKDSAGAQWCSMYPWNNSGSAPTANANADQTITQTFTTLKGVATVTSPARGIIYRLWTKTSGPNTPVMPMQANDSVVISGLTTGVYTFSLTVTDNNQKSGTDNVQITVGTSVVIPNYFTKKRGRKHGFFR